MNGAECKGKLSGPAEKVKSLTGVPCFRGRVNPWLNAATGIGRESMPPTEQLSLPQLAQDVAVGVGVALGGVPVEDAVFAAAAGKKAASLARQVAPAERGNDAQVARGRPAVQENGIGEPQWAATVAARRTQQNFCSAVLYS